MNAQHEAKRKAAEAALRHVVPGELLGVGTGSTVNHLIDLIAEQRIPIAAAVSSSSASTARLRQHGIRVIDLNEVGELPVYIDGADEANAALQLIKGGGGALTREKIIAGASKRFLCIVDESKQVATLGRFPLPVEVLAMAQAYLSREFRALGGRPLPRNGFITDDGNPIIDIHDLSIDDPLALEARISLIPGVVTVGLFAHRPADLLIVGSTSGAREIRAAD